MLFFKDSNLFMAIQTLIKAKSLVHSSKITRSSLTFFFLVMDLEKLFTPNLFGKKMDKKDIRPTFNEGS